MSMIAESGCIAEQADWRWDVQVVMFVGGEDVVVVVLLKFRSLETEI